MTSEEGGTTNYSSLLRPAGTPVVVEGVDKLRSISGRSLLAGLIPACRAVGHINQAEFLSFSFILINYAPS
uniref:Uncharacterized protein n=1 Tax=Pristionchus pacificus TaxID=54126 RepID=A0A2A6BHM4_PRIPA|eukprot:PDM65389.1 hypothetical protein PRIPAC_52331 [Pristionchus pacificus]